MTYGDFKDSTKRTASDKILRDKAFNIAKNPKYDGYQRGLASMVYKVFAKTKLQAEQLKMKIFLTKNYLKNYTNHLLETLTKGKYTHPLEIIIGMLILLICN